MNSLQKVTQEIQQGIDNGELRIKKIYSERKDNDVKYVIDVSEVEAERVLTVEVLHEILKKNNKELYEAVVKREEAIKNGCNAKIKEVEYKLGVESGEALLLLNLIYYLEGKIELEQIV